MNILDMKIRNRIKRTDGPIKSDAINVDLLVQIRIFSNRKNE